MSVSAEEVEVVWALDFDGVLCDSVGESALSGWKSALIQWPELFGSADSEARKEAVLEGMRLSRPVVETGWENVVMIRALRDGKTAEEILDSWDTLLPGYMKEWGLERVQLLELFGGIRDGWMKEDLDGWLGANRFYPGIPEATRVAMENPKGKVYIVTTKQARFTHTLMNNMAQLPVALEDIYSTAESGSPKSDILTMLMERHPNAKSYRFFEDKLGTLEKVVRLESMSPWELYLVDWGYNTKKEKEVAEGHPRMQLIGKEGYLEAMEL